MKGTEAERFFLKIIRLLLSFLEGSLGCRFLDERKKGFDSVRKCHSEVGKRSFLEWGKCHLKVTVREFLEMKGVIFFLRHWE